MRKMKRKTLALLFSQRRDYVEGFSLLVHQEAPMSSLYMNCIEHVDIHDEVDHV